MGTFNIAQKFRADTQDRKTLEINWKIWKFAKMYLKKIVNLRPNLRKIWKIPGKLFHLCPLVRAGISGSDNTICHRLAESTSLQPTSFIFRNYTFGGQ